jgi:NAD(P)-dependent dehydrogenase (short-subunit alcohol dehydrogenase family)
MRILITGGASGLGEAITKTLAKDLQNTVYFTYHTSLDSALKIEAAFSNAKSIKCDFTNKKELKTLLNFLNQSNIDVLINNAYNGDFLNTHFHKIKINDFIKDFNANIIPTIEITQAAINCFRKKKYGKIITILSSSLLNIAPIGSSVYVANKAYLAQLTKVWATENSQYNITSNSISPSFMITHFTSSIDERFVQQMEDKHPLKRLLNVTEVADSVLFLVNASMQINGIDIVINAASTIK